MYCSECGRQGLGKFCSHCGHRLELGGPSDEANDIQPYVGDWANEVRHDLLLRVPEVRAEIERNARLAKKGISGEQFLELYDKLVPVGVPLAKLATIIQPLYSSWGIHTGKQRTHQFNVPAGQLIVRVLCSLARNGQTVRRVEQASDGCALEAVLPSDVWSFAGDLLVTVRRDGMSSVVEAATKIKGQWFDWGKSGRCLDQLYGDLASRAAA